MKKKTIYTGLIITLVSSAGFMDSVSANNSHIIPMGYNETRLLPNIIQKEKKFLFIKSC